MVDDKIMEMALEMLEASTGHARDAAYKVTSSKKVSEFDKHWENARYLAKNGKISQSKTEYRMTIKSLRELRADAQKIPDDDFSDWGLRILHTLNIFRPKDHVFDTISDVSRSGGHVKDVTRATIIKRIDEIDDLAQKEMNSL